MLKSSKHAIVLFHKFNYQYFYLIVFYYRKDRIMSAINNKLSSNFLKN